MKKRNVELVLYFLNTHKCCKQTQMLCGTESELNLFISTPPQEFFSFPILEFTGLFDDLN